MKKSLCLLIVFVVLCILTATAQVFSDATYDEDMKKLSSSKTFEEGVNFSEELLKKYANDDSFRVMEIASKVFVYNIMLEHFDKAIMVLPIYTQAAKKVSISDYFDVCRNVAHTLANRTDKYPDAVIDHAKQALKSYSKDLPVPKRQKKYITNEKWKDYLNNYFLISIKDSLGWGYYYKKEYKKALQNWSEQEKRYSLMHRGIAFYHEKEYAGAFKNLHKAKFYYDLDAKKYPEGLEEYYTKTLEKLPKKFGIEKEKTIIESTITQQLLANLPLYEKKQDVIPFMLDIIGGEHVSNDLLKGKIVVLNLWSEGCGYCITEIPVLSKLHKEYSDKGVMIISANIGGKYSIGDLPTLKEEYGLDHPIANMPQELSDTFPNDGVPQTYIYDKNGQLRYYMLGFKNGGYIVFKAQIEALLAE